MFEILGAALAVVVHSAVEEPTAGSSGALSKGARCFVSEFLGTFFLVLTVGLNVLTMSPAELRKTTGNLQSRRLTRNLARFTVWSDVRLQIDYRPMS